MERTKIYEEIEWSNFRWHNAPDRVMDRILLIGDSIVAGHGEALWRILKDEYGVDYFATSKCVSDVDYHRELEYILKQRNYRAIVFNNTLHGFDIQDDVFAAFLADEMRWLADRTELLIWRTGTPMRVPGDSSKFHERTPRIEWRNRAAAKVAEELGLPVIDLYSEMVAHPELVAGDGTHYLPEGTKYQARLIADFLRAEIAKQR